MKNTAANKETAIKERLAALPKMQTSVIAGKPVTRWSELYEIGTWGRIENLYPFTETLKRLVG